MQLVTLIIIVAAVILPLSNAATDKIICYYGSWATYRNGNGRMDIDSIDPTLCTHIIYTFVGLNQDSTVRVLDPWNDVTNNGFSRFVGLKARNPNVKLLLAIGGFNEGSAQYSIMANSAARRATFINSIIGLLRTYRFDGLDLDWEYPGLRGGQGSDRAAFIQLISELRTRFNPEGWLLTAAVAAVRSYHISSYDVPNMNRYLDYIHVMSYDLHGSWDGVTGLTSPLFRSTAETSEYASQLNVDSSMRAWISAGASPQKLIMGLAFYGNSFTLASTANNRIAAPTIGAGAPGPYTSQSGYLGYMEICERIRNNGWTEVWDDVQKNPYAYSGNQWVGFDSVRSLTLKAQHAKSLNLGGVMMWSIDTDDFRNVCGQGTFPLLRTLNSELIGSTGTTTAAPTTTTTRVTTTTTGASTTTTRATTTTTRATTTTTRATTTTTRATTTTTRATSTTTAPGITTTTRAPVTSTASTDTTPSTYLCPPSGFLRDPSNCSVFFRCTTGTNAILSRTTCQSGLLFDNVRNICNYARAVQC